MAPASKAKPAPAPEVTHVHVAVGDTTVPTEWTPLGDTGREVGVTRGSAAGKITVNVFVREAQ